MGFLLPAVSSQSEKQFIIIIFCLLLGNNLKMCERMCFLCVCILNKLSVTRALVLCRAAVSASSLTSLQEMLEEKWEAAKGCMPKTKNHRAQANLFTSQRKRAPLARLAFVSLGNLWNLALSATAVIYMKGAPCWSSGHSWSPLEINTRWHIVVSVCKDRIVLLPLCCLSALPYVSLLQMLFQVTYFGTDVLVTSEEKKNV